MPFRGKAAAALDWTLPPLGTAGSVIATVPPMPELALKFADVYVPENWIAATTSVPLDMVKAMGVPRSAVAGKPNAVLTSSTLLSAASRGSIRSWV